MIDADRKRSAIPERHATPAELELKEAMDAYKRTSGRMFPTWTEVLEVIRGLGYERASGDAREAS